VNRPAITGAVLLALSATGLWIEPRIALAAWLSAWWWCLGLVLGCLVNVWMHGLTGGAWGAALRPVAFALARRMPWVLLSLLPVLAGFRLLYPWAADPAGSWLAQFARPAFVQAWLAPPFFFARLVFYGLVWWWLARPLAAPRKGHAASSVLVHSVVTSLASVDLVMSLMPGWYSTAFGLVALSTQALAGAAIAVLLQARRPLVRPAATFASSPPVSRDLGNLLLMWSMSWAYLAFMEFLIIWAEDLPREIAWYVPRVQTGWAAIGVALVVLQLGVPFLALLFRSVKDRPGRLAAVAALLLVSSALDVAWTVLPSVAPHSLHGWWLLPLAFAGLALLLFGGVPAAVRESWTNPADGGLQHAHP
jgi:hypothetical protein